MAALPGEVCAVAVPVNVATAIPAVTSISAAFLFIIASLLPGVSRAPRTPQGFVLLSDTGSMIAKGAAACRCVTLSLAIRRVSNSGTLPDLCLDAKSGRCPLARV
jgi:hypothetical protein